MTDRHIRILRLVAHNAQRELDDDHSLDHIGDTASTGRREHLERAAARTRARVADADQRRRNDHQFPTPDLVSGDAPRVLVRVAHHAQRPGCVPVEQDDLSSVRPRSARRTRCRHTWASALWGRVLLSLVGASPPPGDASLLLALHRGQGLLALPRQHLDDL